MVRRALGGSAWGGSGKGSPNLLGPCHVPRVLQTSEYTIMKRFLVLFCLVWFSFELLSAKKQSLPKEFNCHKFSALEFHNRVD